MENRSFHTRAGASIGRTYVCRQVCRGLDIRRYSHRKSTTTWPSHLVVRRTSGEKNGKEADEVDGRTHGSEEARKVARDERSGEGRHVASHCRLFR